MNTLEKVEDRWLMVALTLAVLIAFTITRDALIGDVFKVLIGGTVAIFTRRSEKLLVAEPGQGKAIVDEFLGR